MTTKIVVACHNAGGEPDFYFCKVNHSQEQYDNGDHYDAAIDAAREEGYDPDFVAFDEGDGPQWLFDRFVWESATTVDAA